MASLRMLILSTLLATGAALGAEEPSSRRTIATEGESVVKVVPDEVQMVLEVTDLNKDLVEGRKLHASRVQAVIASTKSAGVLAKDIQTDYIRVDSEYENEETGARRNVRVFKGYRYHTYISILLRDIPKFETLLSAALTSGAEHVAGIEFRTSQLRKHRDAARAAALRAAWEKAVAMAGELGQKVGRPRTIQEGRGSWFGSYGSRFQSTSQNSASVDDFGTTGEDGSLAPGLISIRATVSVIFDLE